MAFKFCPECGFKLDREYKFCPECGFKFSNDVNNGDVKENNVSADIDVDIEQLFDAQLDKQQEKEEEFQKQLKKANVLVLKEEYNEAADAYSKLADETVDRIEPYIGMVRAISNNYTVYESEKLNSEFELLFNLFGKDECFAASSEFMKFFNDREKYLLKKEIQERERKEREAKRKQEEQRLKMQQEKERKLKEEKAKKERELKEQLERERLQLEQEKRAKKEQLLSAIKSCGDYSYDKIGLEKKGNKFYYGKTSVGGKLEFDVLLDCNDFIFLMLAKPWCMTTQKAGLSLTSFKTEEGVGEFLRKFEWFFPPNQSALIKGMEIVKPFLKEEEYYAAPKIRLINEYEAMRFRNEISQTGNPYWIALMPEDRKKRGAHCVGADITDTTIIKYVRPVIIIDKPKLIEVITADND